MILLSFLKCIKNSFNLSFPGLFIVDKEGIIQYYTVNNLLCGRSINELLRILRSIQYIKDDMIKIDWLFHLQKKVRKLYMLQLKIVFFLQLKRVPLN